MRGNDSRALCCAITSCHDLFWPLIARDFERRSPTCAHKRTLEDRCWNKPTTNIQAFTANDGSFQAFPHDRAITFVVDEPIPNPFPDLPTFKRSEIHMLSEITPRMLKVEIGGKFFCLKFAIPEQRAREVAILQKMPIHTSLPRIAGAMGKDKSHIEALVVPYIDGRDLLSIRSCTLRQKKKWKTQMLEAVRVLHKHKAIWGDVQPQNVMMQKETEHELIIDFGGGFDSTRVSKDNYGTEAGDLEGVENLRRFIDALRTEP